MHNSRFPVEVYHGRVRRMQELMRAEGLDAVVVAATESEPANVRYFSNYWPVFESAGVLIGSSGDALLLIGPESGTLAEDHSCLKGYRKLVEFRESSDPEYPEVDRTTFADVFDEISGGKGISHIGLVGSNIMPLPVYQGIVASSDGAEVVEANELLRQMRAIKSEDEVALIREAADIAARGFDRVVERIRPGMTEVQVAAECLHAVLSDGAEAPGFMIWCVSGRGTNQAISKSRLKKIEKGEVVQISMGAMVGGYVASFGRPLVFGKVKPEVRRMFDVCREANQRTHECIKPGIEASAVAREVHDLIRQRGLGDCIVYGPAHGIGMAECEYPFIESTSDYPLQESMTFAVDTFLAGADFGMRIEDPVVVRKDGEESLCSHERELVVL